MENKSKKKFEIYLATLKNKTFADILEF